MVIELNSVVKVRGQGRLTPFRGNPKPGPLGQDIYISIKSSHQVTLKALRSEVSRIMGDEQILGSSDFDSCWREIGVRLGEACERNLSYKI